MSLHYFVDGHNLLHSTSRWDAVPRAERRAAMLRTLAEERPMGSPRNGLTVVFDGHGPHLRLAGPALVEAVFSGDKDADTVIKERVAELANARTAVVVTNDKAIRLSVRKRGAKVLSCEEFLAMSKKATVLPPGAEIDIDTTAAINNELKSIWKVK